MKRLTSKMSEFDGETDNFTYTDPVDGIVTRNQGLRFMKPEWRVIYRLSGTGSVGATVRVYYEKVSKDNLSQSNAEAL